MMMFNSKFEGDFVNNKKEGYGLITTKDQTQIRGNFKDDIPVGNVEVCLPGKELWETVNLDKKS